MRNIRYFYILTVYPLSRRKQKESDWPAPKGCRGYSSLEMPLSWYNGPQKSN